jgi:hypothetical protein
MLEYVAPIFAPRRNSSDPWARATEILKIDRASIAIFFMGIKRNGEIG